MRLNRVLTHLTHHLWVYLSALFLWISCSTPPPVTKLSISEQIQVDTQKAQALFNDFEKKVVWVKQEETERYLTQIAKRLAKVEDGFDLKLIRVRIYQDAPSPLKRFYAFPGTTISIPLSFLQSVNYENELAAGVAFELGNILKRHLAKKIEKINSEITGNVKINLFGKGNVFELNKEERKESILAGMRMLYYSGYDLRGMVSFFQRQLEFNESLEPDTKIIHLSEMQKKELESNIREAQLAKGEYMPSLDPVVRSAEFIKMKKGLNH